jgi:hypothetical protein
MQLKPLLGLAAVLLLGACSNLAFWSKSEEVRSGDEPQIPSRVHLEFQDVQYDGLVLSGRVLISPVEKNLRLDKRLIPTVDVDIQSPTDCARQPHAYLRTDAFPLRARGEDLLVLKPGYWYGATVRFSLFSEHFTGIGPECIDAQLVVFSFEGKIVASKPIRAVRPARPSMDGGIPEGLRPWINDPAFSILKKFPEVDLSGMPDVEDAGVPPQP